MLLFKRDGVGSGSWFRTTSVLLPLGRLLPRASRTSREGEAWRIPFLSFHFLLSTSHILCIFTDLVHGKARSLRKRALFCSLLCPHCPAPLAHSRHSKNCEQGRLYCCPSIAYCLEGESIGKGYLISGAVRASGGSSSGAGAWLAQRKASWDCSEGWGGWVEEAYLRSSYLSRFLELGWVEALKYCSLCKTTCYESFVCFDLIPGRFKYHFVSVKKKFLFVCYLYEPPRVVYMNEDEDVISRGCGGL